MDQSARRADYTIAIAGAVAVDDLKARFESWPA